LGVVISGDHRQRRHFLAAQTSRPAPRALRQPDVGWLQRIAVTAEEIGERLTIHAAYNQY
jgi:hypothetical protein